MHTILILHNIRSTHNVGSLFRTADAAGVTKVHLTGYTPDPIDRFGRDRKDIAKVSLGAEKSVSWEHRDSLEELISELRDAGYAIVGVEQDDASIPYTSYTPTQPVALILGTEVTGLTESERQLCDTILEIPMHGNKESLNVSVAGGIVLFRLKEALAR